VDPRSRPGTSPTGTAYSFRPSEARIRPTHKVLARRRRLGFRYIALKGVFYRCCAKNCCKRGDGKEGKLSRHDTSRTWTKNGQKHTQQSVTGKKRKPPCKQSYWMFLSLTGKSSGLTLSAELNQIVVLLITAC